MAKKESNLKKVNIEELDITDVLFKSLAKLLQEKSTKIDPRIHKQFESLLNERKVTYEYKDGIFKLKEKN